MKILITGAKGQLGKEIINLLTNMVAEIGTISEIFRNAVIIATDENNLDISKKDQVDKFFDKVCPDVVINCAAYTNVDECEKKKTLAFNINSLGTRNLAIATQKVGAKIIHISTDYVFSGDNNRPFNEMDEVKPNSIYGKTKLMGENYVKEYCNKHFIVRTAWLYGYKGNNFVYTMMKLGDTNSEIKVVNDQRGNPTHANDLAYHILKLVETENYGVYHCTGKGECSWFDFASEIMKLSKKDCKVNPCTTAEFPRPAKRPEYSSLDNKMLRETIGDDMRDWKEALNSFISKALK